MRLDRQALLENLLKPEAYGLALFDALFAGKVLRAYDRAMGRAEGYVRVRLWIDEDAADLHALPWERLYHIPGEQPLPLTTSARTPFSRYTSLSLPEPEPLAGDPVRLLFAVANPRDLPKTMHPVDVEDEIQSFHQALGELGLSNRFQVTILPGRTGLSPHLLRQLQGDGYEILEGATTLTRILRHLPRFRILHFVGHGVFRKDGPGNDGTAALYLETEDGTRDRSSDDDIVPKLANIDPLPHLIFLEACQTATRPDDAQHPWIGLGPRLVRTGVPAVVAMQDPVPMRLARELMSHFYRELLEQGLVDRALNVARNLLFEAGQVDWAIPVLFMRLASGELVRRGAPLATPDHDAEDRQPEIDALAYDHDYYLVRIGAIRELMRDTFTPQELDRFCADRTDFRRVRSGFGFGFSLDDMIDGVITYAEKRVLLPELLSGIQEADSRQFQRHQKNIYD
jgi:hypothetical protein